MKQYAASSSEIFKGITEDNKRVSFSLADAVATIEFDTGEELNQTEVDATNVYLLISKQHVNEMADRVLLWRRMKSIQDIYTASFSATLPDGKFVSFTMKQYLAATKASLPESPFDAEGIRLMFKKLQESEQMRITIYNVLENYLRTKH